MHVNNVSVLGGYNDDALDNKVYRADSWICTSFEHAGLMDGSKGNFFLSFDIIFYNSLTRVIRWMWFVETNRSTY